MNPQTLSAKLVEQVKLGQVPVAISERRDGIIPRTKIDKDAVADFSAWASALHITEQELTSAVQKVGNNARDVIVYLLTHGNSPPRTVPPQ